MQMPEMLCCPKHGSALKSDIQPDAAPLRCAEGCVYPIERGVPRFVPANNYARSFGLQWNRYRKTQLDSHTGLPISRNRLQRIAGGDLRILQGKRVLEVGCGAGRFTEVMLNAGAIVCSVDLSNAVDAAFENFGTADRFFVCQADMRELPFRPQSFDIVLCIGVLQHTPSPEASMATLCRYVRPGGALWIDHYAPDYPATWSRRWLRACLIRVPSSVSLPACRALVASLWPIHRLLWRLTQTRIGETATVVRRQFLKISPVADYQEHLAALGPKLLHEWAMLDTHDTLTDVYKHLRTTEQIATHLAECGMEQIEVAYAGNGVEARARAPENPAAAP